MKMKMLVSTAAAAGFVLAASPAFAWGWPPYVPPVVPPVDPVCDECVEDAIDINQLLKGWQKAFNAIKDVNNAVGVTQTAVNAGNLISLEDLEDPLGEVTQTAIASQWASNSIEGVSASSISEVVQAATNVINSISADEVRKITQDASGGQLGTNYLAFGKGGYSGPEGFDVDVDDATQSAVNAANLVNINALTGSINQESTVYQTALNTAVYETHWVGFGWHYKPVNADVSDFAQSATNVANSISASSFAAIGCDCVDELTQTAYTAQLASNSLSSIGSGLLNVNNITQSAINLANSITVPSGD